MQPKLSGSFWIKTMKGVAFLSFCFVPLLVKFYFCDGEKSFFLLLSVINLNLIYHLQIKVRSVLISLSVWRIANWKIFNYSFLIEVYPNHPEVFCNNSFLTIKQNSQEKTMGSFQWILKSRASVTKNTCARVLL